MLVGVGSLAVPSPVATSRLSVAQPSGAVPPPGPPQPGQRSPLQTMRGALTGKSSGAVGFVSVYSKSHAPPQQFQEPWQCQPSTGTGSFFPPRRNTQVCVPAQALIHADEQMPKVLTKSPTTPNVHMAPDSMDCKKSPPSLRQTRNVLRSSTPMLNLSQPLQPQPPVTVQLTGRQDQGNGGKPQHVAQAPDEASEACAGDSDQPPQRNARPSARLQPSTESSAPQPRREGPAGVVARSQSAAAVARHESWTPLSSTSLMTASGPQVLTRRSPWMNTRSLAHLHSEKTSMTPSRSASMDQQQTEMSTPRSSNTFTRASPRLSSRSVCTLQPVRPVCAVASFPPLSLDHCDAMPVCSMPVLSDKLPCVALHRSSSAQLQPRPSFVGIAPAPLHARGDNSGGATAPAAAAESCVLQTVADATSASIKGEQQAPAAPSMGVETEGDVPQPQPSQRGRPSIALPGTSGSLSMPTAQHLTCMRVASPQPVACAQPRGSITEASVHGLGGNEGSGSAHVPGAGGATSNPQPQLCGKVANNQGGNFAAPSSVSTMTLGLPPPQAAPMRFYSAPPSAHQLTPTHHGQAAAQSSGVPVLVPVPTAVGPGLGGTATPPEGMAVSQAELMHQLLMVALLSMEKESSYRLRVVQLGPGRYEIDGRRVCLRWGSTGGGRRNYRKNRGGAADLVVREEEAEGSGAAGAEMTLLAYLRHCRDINAAASFRESVPGTPAMASIPHDLRLTFGGVSPGGSSSGSESASSSELTQRCASMRKACAEARAREKAAEALTCSRPIRLTSVASVAPAAAAPMR